MLRIGLKVIPEWIGTTSRGSNRIDGAFPLCSLKKNTFQPILGNTLFTGEPVSDPMEIFLDKINVVLLQELTDPIHLLLTKPDVTRFSTATVAWT